MGNCGIKTDSEAASFALKLNAVFILEMVQSINTHTNKTEKRDKKLMIPEVYAFA